MVKILLHVLPYFFPCIYMFSKMISHHMLLSTNISYTSFCTSNILYFHISNFQPSGASESLGASANQTGDPFVDSAMPLWTEGSPSHCCRSPDMGESVHASHWVGRREGKMLFCVGFKWLDSILWIKISLTNPLLVDMYLASNIFLL